MKPTINLFITIIILLSFSFIPLSCGTDDDLSNDVNQKIETPDPKPSALKVVKSEQEIIINTGLYNINTPFPQQWNVEISSSGVTIYHSYWFKQIGPDPSVTLNKKYPGESFTTRKGKISIGDGVFHLIYSSVKRDATAIIKFNGGDPTLVIDFERDNIPVVPFGFNF